MTFVRKMRVFNVDEIDTYYNNVNKNYQLQIVTYYFQLDIN